MDQGVIEVVVKRKKSPGMQIAKILCLVVTVILVFIGITFSAVIGLWSIIPLLLGVAAGIGTYFISLNCNVDFEYALVDRELRVAKILNKERRKPQGTYDLDKLEILAPVNSHQLDSYRNRQGVKEIDYSTHDKTRTKTTYHCYLEGNQKLILEIDTEADGRRLFNAIRTFAPRKVFVE